MLSRSPSTFPEEINPWAILESLPCRLELIDAEIRDVSNDHTPRWLMTARYPLVGASAPLECTVSFDVTETKSSLDRYRASSDGAMDGLWCRNRITGEMWFSARWKEILGFDEAEIPNQREEWLRRIHPGDRERVEKIVESQNKSGEPYRCEYRLRNRSGEYRLIESRGKVVRVDGEEYFAGSHRDVTDDRDREHRYEDILSTIPCLVWVKDSDLRFEYVNDALRQVIGKNDYQILGYTDAEIDPNSAHLSTFAFHDESVLKTGAPAFIPEEALTDRFSRNRLLCTRKVRLEAPIGAKDQRPRILGAAIDITENKRKLSLAEKLLDDLLENAADGIFLKT